MRAGDKVFHVPSGETWILAWADDKEVSPCGWPETLTEAEHCRMVTPASDKEYNDMIDLWAAKTGNDWRISRCRAERERESGKGVREDGYTD